MSKNEFKKAFKKLITGKWKKKPKNKSEALKFNKEVEQLALKNKVEIAVTTEETIENIKDVNDVEKFDKPEDILDEDPVFVCADESGLLELHIGQYW